MNFIAAIALVSTMVGFSVVFHLLQPKALRARLLFFGLLGILGSPSVLFAVYYLHILPETEWFYLLRSWSGSELLALFLGGAGGALATLVPRSLLAFPLFLAIGTAFLPFLKKIITPLNLGEFEEYWEGDVCFQSTASTCGPASAASILRFLELPASEHEIAEASHTSSSGTEAWYLARHLRSRELATDFDFHSTFDPAVRLPAVVGVRLGSSGHFIAVLSINGDLVTFVDPLSGKQHLALNDFLRAYSFTGFHLSVNREDA